MLKIVSEIADSYGLYDFYKQCCENNQFYYNKNEVDQFNRDYSKFYTKPSLPKIYFEENNINGEYKNGKLKFLSEIKNEDSNIQSIFHYNICGADKEKEINVILIHGWKSNLDRLNNIFSESFINKGYNIYSYVLPFHLDRVSKSFTL